MIAHYTFHLIHKQRKWIMKTKLSAFHGVGSGNSPPKFFITTLFFLSTFQTTFMRTIISNCQAGLVKKNSLKILSLIGTVLLLFSSANLFGQTITFPSSCTSKDLTLLKASLPAPAGDRCACSGDRSLILGIHNGTSSIRTSFALWGTLVRKDVNGNIISSQSIFACAGPIGKNGDYYLNATTIKINGVDQPVNGLYPTIHIDCGQSLDITDMHLAWTSANDNQTCDVLYNNPSTINPKCGTQDLIHVDLGVSATVTPHNATCAGNDGSIDATPFGGKPKYNVYVYRKETANATDSTFIGKALSVDSNSKKTFTSLGVGYYTVKISDNSGAASDTCWVNKFTQITNPDGVSKPAYSTTDPGCRQTTGTVNVTSPQSAITYTLEKPFGTVKYTAVSGVFSNVAPDTYILKATKGVCWDTTLNVTVNQPPVVPNAPSPTNNSTICVGSTLNLYANVTADSYSWTGPGGYTSSDQNPSRANATSSMAGTYSLTITSNGCPSDAGTTDVSIDLAPTTATAGADQIRCGSLTSLGLGGNTPTVGTGTWTKKSGPGDVSFSADEHTGNATASVTQEGTYVFTWTIHNGVCADSKEDVTVTFYNALSAPAVCVVQPTLCGAATGKVKFTDLGSGYQYSIKNGASDSWQDCPVFLDVAAGSVTGLVIKNSDGCVSEAATCTTICPENETIEACSASPKNTIARDNSNTLTGTEPQIQAYPNPFNDVVKFVVKAPVAGNGSLEIYNMMGQKVKTVYQGRINAGDQSFELSLPKKQQATLIYIFRVGDKKITGKLLQLNN